MSYSTITYETDDRVAISTLLDSTKTPEFLEFDEVRREKGLRAALDWRDAQFSKYE